MIAITSFLYLCMGMLGWMPLIDAAQRHRHVVIVSAVSDTSTTTLWKLSVMFKSLQVLDHQMDDGTKEFHVCSISNHWPDSIPARTAAEHIAVTLKDDLGIPVTVVCLRSNHSVIKNSANKNQTLHRQQRYDNFLCSIHIANLLFHQRDYTTPILFTGLNLVVTSSTFLSYIRDIFATERSEKDSFLLCAPRVTIRLNKMDLIPGAICELDLLAMTSPVGHRLYSTMNATALASSSSDVDNIIALGGGKAYHYLTFVDEEHIPIVRAGQYWHHPLTTIPAIVEFDGSQHLLIPITTSSPSLVDDQSVIESNMQQCYMTVHVEWEYFNSIPPLSQGLEYLFGDPTLLHSFAGCSPLPQFYVQNTAIPPILLDTNIYRPKVFDGILFYDEVSMLRLRLLALRDVVDHHIIVESNRTFTGKLKPLYFADNIHLFEEFLPRITHVVVEQMSNNHPANANDVWENEYYSRDAINAGLNIVEASDMDIVLVGDTDEIPHPDAIHNLRAKAQYIQYRTQRREVVIPQVFKIFVDNFLYHFDCYVREVYAKGTPLTATILGDSKRLIENYMENIPIKRFLSASRLYLQHESPIRFDNVISPGGWHLSFFESIERMKRKLESYGHQNFIKQFSTEHHHNDTANVLIDLDGTNHIHVNDNNNIHVNNEMTIVNEDHNDNPVDEYLSKELPIGVEISMDAIAQRVAKGAPIDYRQVKGQVTCQSGKWQQDPYSEQLKSLWESLATKDDMV